MNKFLLLIICLCGCVPNGKQNQAHKNCKENYYQTLFEQADQEAFLVTIKGSLQDGEVKTFYLPIYELYIQLKKRNEPDIPTKLIEILRGDVALSLGPEKPDNVVEYGNCDRFQEVFGNGEYYAKRFFFDCGQWRADIEISRSDRGCMLQGFSEWCYLIEVQDESGYLSLFDFDEYRYWLARKIPEN